MHYNLPFLHITLSQFNPILTLTQNYIAWYMLHAWFRVSRFSTQYSL